MQQSLQDEIGKVAAPTQVIPDDQRRLTGLLRWIVGFAAIALAVITFYMGIFGTFGPTVTRALHLGIIIPLALLLYPAQRGGTGGPGIIDIGLALAAVAAFFWAGWSETRFQWRMAYVDPIPTTDMIFGLVAIGCVLEATRRTIGYPILFLVAIFVIYALAGPYWPGILQHTGTSLPRLVEQSYMLSEGLFNIIVGISATFLFTFLAFGVFLQVAGGDQFFMNLALTLAGHRTGGPAKVSIISSALMGMLSGSTVSNVVTTGSISIPLMKRTGFKPHEAAAIEATASLGGALTPPLMGAGVFLMAQFTGVPLIEIIGYSIVPALLYFVSIYAYVNVRATKRGLRGLSRSELPDMGKVMTKGWHLFFPIILLIALLVLNYSPFFASTVATLSMVVVSYLRKETRITPARLLLALEASTRVAIIVAVLSAAAALIFGILTITGLIVKMTSIILAFSFGSLFVGVILIALISYVVGMGLPVTASYVIVAALGASALGELGVSILAAHLIIYWLSQDSTITPPVCMTAFVAAGIAKASPTRTGFDAVLIAKALYIIPMVFAFGTLLSDSLWLILFGGATLAMSFWLIPVVLEGFWLRPLSVAQRLLCALAAMLFGIASMLPIMYGLVAVAAGVAIALPLRIRQTLGAHPTKTGSEFS